MRYFVLEGHRVREGTLQEYSSLIASDMRRVGRTAVGAVDVSTVFMMGATPPEFFETMVFGGDFTARLNMNLREDKHWSYGARSGAAGAVGQRMWFGP